MRFLLVVVVFLGTFVAACRGEEDQFGLVEGEGGTRLALDKAGYVYGVDDSVAVYGSGFKRDEYVLPEILGASSRSYRAEGTYADANGAFSTTISLNAGGPFTVLPGVYTLRVTGGEGSVAAIPVVVSE